MSETFDVDKCVNEDGRKCHINRKGEWVDARFVCMDGCVYLTHSDTGYMAYSNGLIRNIQPRPRTQAIAVMENNDGERYAYVPFIKSGHSRKVGEVTIDLDRCEQVANPGVMTPDELDREGISIHRLTGGGYVIHRNVCGKRWSTQAGWNLPGTIMGKPTKFGTFHAAQIEATRIVREKLI